MTDQSRGGVYLEMSRIGGAMEVRAIASEDGLEVTFIAPANTPQSELERLAVAKLAYVRRKAAPPGDEGSSGGRGGAGGRRRGELA